MVANTWMLALFLIVVVICVTQDHNAMAGRNACDQSQPIPGTDGRASVATRTCVYNGCYGCFSTHVSADLDEVCKQYYKDINNVWQSYKCCVYTPNQCPPSRGGGFYDNPLKRFLRNERRPQLRHLH